MADWAKSWRLELFHKSLSELSEKSVPLLLDNSCSRINITNKVRLLQAANNHLPAIRHT